MRVTLRPRDSRIAAREAEAIPLPREDTTPPVTKTNLVMSFLVVVKQDYRFATNFGVAYRDAQAAKSRSGLINCAA
jgi:hypothetical protein